MCDPKELLSNTTGSVPFNGGTVHWHWPLFSKYITTTFENSAGQRTGTQVLTISEFFDILLSAKPTPKPTP